MYQPLSQFICDNCRLLIEQPEGGIVIACEDVSANALEFRIVHLGKDGCHLPEDAPLKLSDPLADFLESARLMDWQMYVVADSFGAVTRSRFEELIRRCTVPYYEEARCIADLAEEPQKLIASQDAEGFYLPGNLRGLIERHEREARRRGTDQ